MTTDQVVELGRLLSDATRVALLDALFDGRSYTVTELRTHVGVAASTASEQLARLLDAGLVAVEPRGRHRYYRLRAPEVAVMLESLFDFGRHLPVTPGARIPTDLAFARTCYDHLAGAVAVGITDEMLTNGLVEHVDSAPTVTPRGHALLARLGLNAAERTGGRPVLRRCLDWSERRPHLGGALPAQLLCFMLDERWFVPKRGSRALRLTDSGRTNLATVFGYAAP